MAFANSSPSGPPNAVVLTVSTLNRLVRDCLESSFPLAWVGGEVSNLTYAASGHVYFTLKDESAQVRCVMWRNRAQLLGWRLANGDRIEIHSLVSFYEARGEFQLNVEAVRRAGQGNLFERFLQLKAKLEAEGLFAPESKRPLPQFPSRIGIVTSPQAAALRDVMTTLRRRAPHVSVTLYPTAVQGEGASLQIADAVSLAARDGNDVVILCRGGGSIEDLWAFNEEVVARAIRAAVVPVVSGIGHETDFTLADFAADLRAPTPTAAAELAAPDRETLLARLDALQNQIGRLITRHIANQGQRLDWLAGRLAHPADRLIRQQAAVSLLGQRISLAWQRQHERNRLLLGGNAGRLRSGRPRPDRLAEGVQNLLLRLRRGIDQQISQDAGKLNAAGAGLNQLNPLAVLTRGYALARDRDGRAVRDASKLAAGDSLQLSFARGAAEATVVQVVTPEEAN